MSLNAKAIVSVVADLSSVDEFVLMDDSGFVKLLGEVCQYGKYAVAIEALTSYVQDNY